MTEILDEFLFPRRPTAARPLLGQTVLVVEDSRFAGETMRLICLRGGARIRRADSLRSAARHLTTYHPTVVVVDLGLPDGSGLSLIEQLARATPRVPVLLALSGDPSQQAAAEAAGADDFLPKPFNSVAAFQAAILTRLPPDARPMGPRALQDEIVVADADALSDDLALIADILDGAADPATLAYAANFAIGLGRSSSDRGLVAEAEALSGALSDGTPIAPHLASLAAAVQQRLRPEGAVAV